MVGKLYSADQFVSLLMVTQVSDCRYNVFIVYPRILDSLQDLPDKSRQKRVVSHAHCLKVCEKTRSHHETQPRIRGKRDVKLPW